ncbi:MAG: hypothetical protein K6T88_08215 [Bacillus sp. (in: Bacteria)]|nr:hypothetical protein [Bacillus sp. (in: firmicutes)]
MVIQANMSSEAIVEVWAATADIFTKNTIPIIKQSLETLVEDQQLTLLLKELNAIVGSSSTTCIEGG